MLEQALTSRTWKHGVIISPEDEANALLIWVNQPYPIDQRILGRLYVMAIFGRFHFWNCPMCSDLVVVASHYDVRKMGTTKQRPTLRYHLKYPVDRRCDSCRCFDITVRNPPKARKDSSC